MSATVRRVIGFAFSVVAWIASAAPAWACPVCFRMEEGPEADGVFAAVLVLLGVTSGVLAGFAVFIHSFVQRLRSNRVAAGQDLTSTTEGGQG